MDDEPGGSDGTTDDEVFLSFAQGVFLRVVQARHAGQLDDVRGLIGQGMRNQLEATAGADAPAVARVVDARLLDRSSAKDHDTRVVRFRAETAGSAGSAGSTGAGDLAEDWVFHRSAAMRGSADALAECPGCGAPLRTDADGGCAYCRFPLGSGGWQVVRTNAVPARKPSVRASTARGGSPRRSLVIAGVLLAVVVGAAALVAIVRSRTPSSALAATGTFTSGLGGTFDFDSASYTGTSGGSCAQVAAATTGVHLTDTFVDTQQRDESLGMTVTLKGGAHGPGTYGRDALDVQISLIFEDHAGGTAGSGSVVWSSAAPDEVVDLAIQPDGSATLRVADLAPDHDDERPLTGTVSLACS